MESCQIAFKTMSKFLGVKREKKKNKKNIDNWYFLSLKASLQRAYGFTLWFIGFFSKRKCYYFDKNIVSGNG